MRLLPAIVVLLVVPSFAGAEPWTMVYHDPAHGGTSADAGPGWGDIAWIRHLPGSDCEAGGLVIVNGKIFALTANEGKGSNLTFNGTIEIDERTGAWFPFLTFPNAPSSMATDGSSLYVGRDDGLWSYSIATRQVQWHTGFPALTPPVNQALSFIEVTPSSLLVTYDLLSTKSASLYHDDSWADQQRPTGPAGPDAGNKQTVAVGMYDRGTGRQNWLWVLNGTGEAAAATSSLLPVSSPRAVPYPSAAVVPSASEIAFSMGAMQLGSLVYVSVLELGVGTGAVPEILWALRANDGTPVFSYEQQGSAVKGTKQPGEPTGDSQQIYVKLANLTAVNPASGAPLWQRSVGVDDSTGGSNGAEGALAYDGAMLYETTPQTVYAFEARQGTEAWPPVSLPRSSTEHWSREALMVTSTSLLAVAYNDGAEQAPNPTDGRYVAAYSYDKRTGAEEWRDQFNISAGMSILNPVEAALGDGLLVLFMADGTVAAIGTTSASIGVNPLASTPYPPVGAPLTVDLSRGSPGEDGPATSYAVDWGDGTRTPWQTSPQIVHTFNASGDIVARFLARNAAGQESSSVQTFHVGAPAPNFISVAFEPQNQNVTFFVLGLAITLAGALFGVARGQMRSRRFRQEMTLLERNFEETRDIPEACEGKLSDHGARARALATGGRIGEGQAALLVARVDELRKMLRLAEIDQGLHFLPYRLVLNLREMLADGRITSLEREHFVAALAADPLLLPEQKERVQALVDGWLRTDQENRRRGTA